MTWEIVASLLPWLLILVCPVAMFWMMRGMSHGESGGADRAQTGPDVDQARAQFGSG